MDTEDQISSYGRDTTKMVYSSLFVFLSSLFLHCFPNFPKPVFHLYLDGAECTCEPEDPEAAGYWQAFRRGAPALCG
jgi:hypothetical protein